jgi:hypothetical protein
MEVDAHAPMPLKFGASHDDRGVVGDFTKLTEHRLPTRIFQSADFQP